MRSRMVGAIALTGASALAAVESGGIAAAEASSAGESPIEGEAAAPRSEDEPAESLQRDPWPGGGDEPRLGADVVLGATYLSPEIRLGRGSDDQAPNSAALAGARMTYLAVPNLLVGFDAEPRLYLEAETVLAPSSTRGDAEAGRPSYFAAVLGVRAQGRVLFWPRNELSPFALGGLGVETLFTRSPWARSPDAQGAIFWGVGAEYELSRHAGFRFDLRQGVSPARTRSLTSSYEVHAGLFFRFGNSARPPVNRRIFADGPPADARGSADRVARAPDSENERTADDRDSEPAAGAEDGAVLSAGGEAAGGGPLAPRDRSEEANATQGEVASAEGESATSEDGEAEGPRRDGEELDEAENLAELAEDIHFDVGSTELAPEAREPLEEITEILEARPELRVEVSGHTDARGPRSRNVMLSHARARRVTSYLVEQGIDADRLEPTGYGPDHPVADNDTAEGRAKNRRIEIEPLETTD